MSTQDPPRQHRWPRRAGRELELLERVLLADEWGLDGPLQAEFEERFTAMQTSAHGLCVMNGTVALQLALEALDVGVGDEVIIPGLTWQATAASVLDVNAVPVLVDVEPETYCIDPALVEAAITPRTKAIIVVHLYSSLADMARILEIARRHDLRVVEDCAHAPGARWNGRGVGSIGDIGCFSFQSAKVLAAGEGGFVTTNDPSLHEALYSLRNCGRKRDGARTWRPVQSGNYRMSEWQAAVLCAQLDPLPDQLRRRAENFARADRAIAGIPGLTPMLTRPGVEIRAMYRYMFRYDGSRFGLRADAFREAISAATGISVRGPYAPLNTSPYYRPLTKRRNRLSEEHATRIDVSGCRLPVAERAHRTEGMIVSHEVFLDPPETIDALVDAIKSLWNRTRQGEPS